MKIQQLRILMTELERVDIRINILQQTARECTLSDEQKKRLEALTRQRAAILDTEVGI